jgi:phosphoenolpyruvate synthase/pyruvate phosphate dikinase
MPLSTTDVAYIRWFADLGLDDMPLVGGKNASLGELYRALAAVGVRVPPGFAITADAYRVFLHEAHLDEQIAVLLKDLNTHDLANLRQRGRQVRQAMLAAPLPAALEVAILEAYDRLSADSHTDAVDVAVRSSATAEDLPGASFAGQQETYLNVQGHAALLDTCKRCFASLFTDRAISYRTDKGFDHSSIALSIGVQRMVRSDRAASGVMFSIDTETGFRDAVLINAAYGLGENVVQGTVNPDEYYVFKPTLQQGFRPILQKRLGTKEYKLVYDVGGGKMTKNVPVAPAERARYVLADDDILMLARWACLIEDHYSTKHGGPTPMDMEWAKDGLTGELFIVQARPETVQGRTPMLGFRGASRYYDPRYRDGFALECQAMRQVREEMGLTNVKLMIPFCRTVDEGLKVLAEMATHGLRWGENGLEVYVMCELPSNVILAEAFAELFDGFSIGSNDLTQLVLGVDRDSAIVAHLFDERDPAVKAMIARVITAAKAMGRKIGLCGQAPSDYPEFAQFLVEQGIESISLNPDAVLKTLLALAAMEQTHPSAC